MEQKITLHDKSFVPYLSEDQLAARVAELGHLINADYEGKNPLFVSVLNGAFMFTADLLKRLSIPSEVTFVKLASYRDMESTGDVKEVIGLKEDIKDRHVVIVEDIIDTGNTMATLLPSLWEHKPASIELITLLHKPEALEKEISIKYIGFDIPTKFVVGYGLDYNGLGRNYSVVYQLE